MSRIIIFVILISLLIVTPSLAISTTTVEGSVSGSVTYCQKVSMEVSGDGLKWPAFGANATSDYTYDGSQASVLTNGKTSFTRTSTVDQSSSNYYAANTALATTNMGLAEDTAGMMNIQPNEPQNMCDASNFLVGEATSGSYPISETFEGATGVVLHEGGSYESEVGLNNGDVHLSGAADIESEGYLYQDKKVTSMKGFDKNSTGLNLLTSETLHTIIRTATVDNETEVHKRVTSDYTSIEPAFDEIIEEEESEDLLTSISTERLDEFINGTNTTVEVNATPTEYGEARSLQSLINQTIIRE